MTSTPIDASLAQPDVAAFVAEVRARLSDLDADQRDELLDGLEADLSEQLSDGTSEVLADPAAYAAELRVAAGLPAVAPRSRWRGHDRLGGALDDAGSWWAGRVEASRPLARAWAVALAARPAWWVLRAWVAVTLLDAVTGGPESIAVVPTFALPGAGLLLLAVAVVVSVLLGQERLLPRQVAGVGRSRRGVLRVALVGLNVVAALGLVGLAHVSDAERYYGRNAGVFAAPAQIGVVVDGRAVRNIYPYDAAGQPITTGVQLFDGAGRPIDLSQQQAQSGEWGTADRLVGCPWLNGSRRLFNVFPLPERSQKLGSCEERLDERLGLGELPVPPLAQVPPATHTP